MSAEAVRGHLSELRERLGPNAQVDVRWKGDYPWELPEAVRLLQRGTGARALASAAARAAGLKHLIVLLGPIVPEDAAIRGLLAAFELDPLVGFAQPRFADTTGDGIWSLPDSRGGGPTLHPRQMLSILREHYLTTERLSACLAIRREVVAWFETSPDAAEDVPAALLDEMRRARRRGHRNLVMNRVVVATSEPPGLLYPALGPDAQGALRARSPDEPSADDLFCGASHQRFERLAAKVRRGPSAKRLSILMDCRGAQAHHNGTSQAILGLLDGVSREAPVWDVDLLFGEAAAEYHRVGQRHPAMRVITALPERSYAAAIRLDQPWALSTVAEMHRRGLAIAFNMLDTISWDCVYTCPPEVEKTWHFIAEHADGLFYISDFTRRRFDFRFPVAPSVVEVVTHLSLDPEEHRSSSIAGLPEAEHVLVFGNHYDHKAVASTIDILGRAFPYQEIRGLGSASEARHNVVTVASGHLPDDEIDRLVATARLVVFPSYYEGFGLPVVKALAYGRTVIVRASPLWRELAGLTRSKGRLVEFGAPHDLVEEVGRALAGEATQGALPLGGDLDGGPELGWSACARRLIAAVERVATNPDARRWYARDRALGLAGI